MDNSPEQVACLVLDNLLELAKAGATILITPSALPAFGMRYGIAMQYAGFTHGIACSSLAKGTSDALEFVQAVSFFNGDQWSEQELAAFRSRAGKPPKVTIDGHRL